jgi:tRNA A-37 threonylcarbamoyl transferase component Bud32/tetratricopeptide (TPR) repeat protein
MPLFPGDKLGPYEILAPIGSGGMGAVYKARDARLERIVALKQLNGEHSGRFRQEALAIAALNHPNICQLYDVGDNFLIMEYVEGSCLCGPVPEKQAIKVALEILAALEAAHSRGILHRDLKPANILITANGSSKLIDFGLAKQLTPSDTEVTQTLDGAILGTVAYMAPEQAAGQGVDERSDIFSFGTVLYELLSGRRAFQGDSTAAVLTAVMRDQPEPLPVSGELQKILERCLAKQPADRYSSVTELRAALERLTGTSPHGELAPAPHPSLPAQINVGRDAQRAQIGRAYSRVKAGKGLILAVTGEAGIGKTSVLESFLSSFGEHKEEPVLARGRCSQRLAGEEPYLPILESLDNLLGPQPGPSVAAIMKSAAPTWYALVAAAPARANGAEPRQAQPGQSQERMKREFVSLFQELSRARPVILFIDDLHWADVSTIDLLNYLTAHFAGMRVLVLTTYRPSDMALARHPFLAIRGDLQSRGLLEEIALQFLEPKDVEKYLDLEFPGHAFPAEFARGIHAKTEGSPLFMADLVRYLRDTGSILEDEKGWSLGRSLPDTPRGLPASVQGMIQRKIEQVSEQDLKLLLAASVQGHEFDSAVIAEALAIDQAEVEDRLDALERVYYFVRRGAEGEFPDRSLTLNYQFVHVLYQNALYDSLQPTRRASLSNRIAKALVNHYGDQVAGIAARVAVLFEAGRDFTSSAHYYYLAASQSAQLFAFREALALSERGLNAVKALPDGPARKQQELVLQMMKGIALRSTSGWATPQVESVFSKARQLCQDLNDPPELIPVLWATTLFLLIRGNLVECRQRADELMAQAERSESQVYRMAAHHIGGVVREFMGDMVESSRMLERCRELHNPDQYMANLTMFGQDPGTIARAMSSRPLWALGYPDRALERAQETLAIARSQRLPTMIAFALVVLQGIHLYRGEAEAALASGEEIMALCREYELPQEAEWSSSFQAYALHLRGCTTQCIDELKRSLEKQRAISAGLVRSAFLALLGDALRHAGRHAEGLEAIDEAFAHAERSSEGGYLAELHRVRGELLLVAGNAPAAEQSLRQAVQCAAQQQTRSFELRAATSLAELLHATQRSSEARAILGPVYEWFTEGYGTADLVKARTILSEIG